jgi:hypothetical protein
VTSEVRTFFLTRTTREELVRVDATLGRKLDIAVCTSFELHHQLQLEI